MPTLLSTTALLLSSLNHHHHPVSQHCIHHHIECGGGERIPLRHYSSSLKRRPVISACPCHHHQPPPMCPEDPICLGDHTVTFQDLKATGTVQGTTVGAVKLALKYQKQRSFTWQKPSSWKAIPIPANPMDTQISTYTSDGY